MVRDNSNRDNGPRVRRISDGDRDVLRELEADAAAHADPFGADDDWLEEFAAELNAETSERYMARLLSCPVEPWELEGEIPF